MYVGVTEVATMQVEVTAAAVAVAVAVAAFCMLYVAYIAYKSCTPTSLIGRIMYNVYTFNLEHSWCIQSARESRKSRKSETRAVLAEIVVLMKIDFRLWFL